MLSTYIYIYIYICICWLISIIACAALLLGTLAFRPSSSSRPAWRVTVFSSAMGSRDWAMCHWCEYWVSQPHMHDFEDDNFGALCEWCDTFWAEGMVPMGPKHWWCTVPNERSAALWHIALFATHPNTTDSLIGGQLSTILVSDSGGGQHRDSL